MKIFITGATGYIGFNVASAFRRAGHEVWGLVRNEEKARKLIKNEIRPVIGSMQKPESYLNVAEQCSVLVHAAQEQSAEMAELDLKTVETFLRAGKAGPKPKTIIFTDGVWDYGNTGGKLADETSSLAPPKLIAWRPKHASMVLTAQGIKGIAIRPGNVYGKQGQLTNSWFAGAYEEKALKVIGDGNNRWPMVHVDDLADGYLRAAESGLSGEIFNLCDSSRWRVREMAEAAARAAGYTGKIQYIPQAEAAKTMGDFAECLTLDQIADNRKAMRMLGWQPRHLNFVDDVETYFVSWEAHHESGMTTKAKAA
jgi:nucleoside-diphosphate-sugar epimerase